MRIGIPENLLTKSYDAFVISFNKRLNILDARYTLTRETIYNVEYSVLLAGQSWITDILMQAALIIGFDLLPERVKVKYKFKVLCPWYRRGLQRLAMAFLWVVYPMLMWLPPRGMICLLLILEPQLRPIFMVSLQVSRTILSLIGNCVSSLPSKKFTRWIFSLTNPSEIRPTLLLWTCCLPTLRG